MNNEATKENAVSVFYNSACPVCNAGINHQRRVMQKNSNNSCLVSWNDVHENNDLITQLGYYNQIGLDFTRERLHVKDARGDLQIGIDAFISLWKLTQNERWKATLISLPVIYQLTTIFYNVFAFSLFRWNRFKRRW